VLVVEDDPETALAVQQLLALHGYEVQTAHSGNEALAAAAEFDPQVVLLDLRLPVVDGVEVAAHLRVNALRDDLVIIGTTGYPQDFPVAGSHFDLCLHKPLDVDRLLQCVDSALAETRFSPAPMTPD
jgi:CheY-like chemotaxis protein